jgi:hypothetical protein
VTLDWRNSFTQSSELDFNSMEPEDESFVNMVMLYKGALMRINAGAKAMSVLSKRERECMRKNGILHLTMFQGRKYVLTQRAKMILALLK